MAVRSFDVLCDILLVIAITVISLSVIGQNSVGFLTAVVGSFVLVLIIGETIPYTLARNRSEKILITIFPLIDRISSILRPVVIVLGFFGKLALKIARIEPSGDESSERLHDEIMDVVEEGERKGLLADIEKRMIEGVFEFRDVRVSEVMTPRTEMAGIENEATVQDAVAIALEEGFSRIPVYSETRDNIIGILYVKDLLPYWRQNGEGNGPKKVTDVMREPYFVPETKKIARLFNEFRQKKLHMAIVLDEYGGTAGLVTVEDIVEEIVGEIIDEYDKKEELYIKRVDEKSIVANGRVHIDDINDALEINLPESDGFDTIAGFIMTQVGRIPAVNETFEYNGVKFLILDSDRRRVNLVKLTVTTSEE